MQFSTVRSAAQLLLCIILARYFSSDSSLVRETFSALLSYVFISVFLVYPFHLFIYLPHLSPLRNIPGPPPGKNIWRTWLAKEPSPPQLLEWVKAASKHHGDNFHGAMRYYGIGGREQVLVVGSQVLKEVLVTKQYKSFDRPTMARKRIAVQAGDGLIASAGDLHKQQKRKLTPAFSSGAIKDLHPLFWSKANDLVSALQESITKSGSSVVDVLSWTSRSALDIIGVAAWGQDFNAIGNPDTDFLRTYNAMFDISGGGPLINALALAIPMRILMYIPVPYNNRLRKALRVVRAKCLAAVKAKKSQLVSKDSGANKDILSLLIQGGIDDEEALTNQMMTMLAAGHDTSSLSLAWGLYLLCKHPDFQTKLREELHEHLLSKDTGDASGISPDLLDELPYLAAVASEILRLMPSVHTTRREAVQDTTVEIYPIPQGSHMVISGWVCNRLEHEWGEDAEEFMPDRWLDTGRSAGSGIGVDNKFAFHSFSHGARSCIGHGFARAEFLIFLAALISEFKVELEDSETEPTVLYGITMSPAGGMRMKFESVHK